MAKKLLPNDTEFKTWITQIKKQVRGAQIKASIAVNEEMLEPVSYTHLTLPTKA